MNILLVDDHTLFREGVALLLERLGEGITTLEAATCAQALAKLQEHPDIDLILLDLGLPDQSGMDGLAQVREQHPNTPVVVLSSNEERDTILQALDLGAMGFIPKTSSSAVMIAALRLILAKGIYLPPAPIIGEGPPLPPIAKKSPFGARAQTPADLGLTERQAEVLHLILQGKTIKRIGQELDLAASTVKTHVSAVLRALNVTTRTEAVVTASKLGLRFTDLH